MRPITPASASRPPRPRELTLPGAFERDRLLGLELVEGALDGVWGMIAPTGRPLPKPKASPKAGRARKALLVPRVA